jgi:mannose-6-phosphate isomerase-like protein (cupin superfamily)
MPSNQVTVAQGLARLPGPEGERFVELFRHGTLSVELYAPRGSDPQTPHTRDEVYVVIGGRGMFRNGPERHPFERGDVLFVAAGVEHRFENFTDDFAAWVFFYGPEGGEPAA